ncbi:MAG: SoxR reducing system RseC family protein [Fibrobacterales bacterium]
MNKENNICREGIVNSVTGLSVAVTIVQPAACETCQAKSVCNSVESTEKVIDALAAETLIPGERVILEMGERQGWLAVLYTFIIPFFCMLGGLIITYIVSGNESLAALISLATLIPYYSMLFLFKKQITKNFVFTAKKKTS